MYILWYLFFLLNLITDKWKWWKYTKNWWVSVMCGHIANVKSSIKSSIIANFKYYCCCLIMVKANLWTHRTKCSIKSNAYTITKLSHYHLFNTWEKWYPQHWVEPTHIPIHRDSYCTLLWDTSILKDSPPHEYQRVFYNSLF